MNIVEEKLKTKNTTLREFNENVKTSLQNLHDSSGPSVSSTEPVVITEMSNASSTSLNESTISESAFHILPISSPGNSCSTPRKISTNTDRFNVLNREIKNMQTTLQEHISRTEQQMSTLKDEVRSVKNNTNLHHRRLHDEIEAIHQATVAVERLLSDSTQTLKGRIQALSDQVRVSLESKTCITASGHTSRNNGETPALNVANAQETRAGAPNRRHVQTLSSGHQIEYVDIAPIYIIGDSILKGIQMRGLHNDVDVNTLPGKKTIDVCYRLMHSELSTCDTVIVYVGGNDLASGKTVNQLEKELLDMLKTNDNSKRKFYFCTLCPRIDVDVRPLNSMLRKVCTNSTAELLDVHQSFVYEDGSPRTYLYHVDGIHLNAKGSSLLVRALNNAVPIVRHSPQQPRRAYDHERPPHWPRQMGPRRQTRRNQRQPCTNCDLRNHSTSDCIRPLCHHSGQTKDYNRDNSANSRWTTGNHRNRQFTSYTIPASNYRDYV